MIVHCLLGVWHGPQSLNVVAAFRTSIQPKVTVMFHLGVWLIPFFCRIISPKRKGRKK
jgi:hypothetical protein